MPGVAQQIRNVPGLNHLHKRTRHVRVTPRQLIVLQGLSQTPGTRDGNVLRGHETQPSTHHPPAGPW